MSRPRVLVFATLSPVPIDRGDKNRLFHTLQLLRQVAEVRLVCLRRAWEPAPEAPGLLDDLDVQWLPVTKREIVQAGLQASLLARPFTLFRYGPPRVVEFVRQQLMSFHAEVLWIYQLSAYPLLTAGAPGLRVILDMVDSPSLHFELARAAERLPPLARLAASVQWRVPHFEGQAITRCARVLVSSLPDREHMLAVHGQRGVEKLLWLPNCVPAALLSQRWEPAEGRSPQLLFVGNLAYPPNEAGVRYVARSILPLVRAQLPAAEFVVCGARGERLAAELAGTPGLRFTGFVPDLVPFYRAASVLVAPVPLATGSQYKLLEAMAVGLPVVTSPASAKACGLTPGLEAWAGESPDSLAAAVVTLCRQPKKAAHLSAAARAFVAARFTWEAQAALISSVLGLDA